MALALWRRGVEHFSPEGQARKLSRMMLSGWLHA
jgi:hypothetical protein